MAEASLECVQLLGDVAAIWFLSSRLLQICWATMERGFGIEQGLKVDQHIFTLCTAPLLLLSSPLQHPSTHVFDSSAVTKSFTLYLVCCVGEVGASSWGRWAGVCGQGVRLRESFLLFIWGVPPGGALGMTFVESLTPAHTHAHTHHTHARTFHPCLFFPPLTAGYR